VTAAVRRLSAEFTGTGLLMALVVGSRDSSDPAHRGRGSVRRAAATPAWSTPGQRCLDWDLPDPAGLTIEQIRPIRDEISARVRALISELVPRTIG
jgi:protein-tyrosine-phosphatase